MLVHLGDLVRKPLKLRSELNLTELPYIKVERIHRGFEQHDLFYPPRISLKLIASIFSEIVISECSNGL
jgi:hypothetical protein